MIPTTARTMLTICIYFLANICFSNTLILEEIQKAIIKDFHLEGKIKLVETTPIKNNKTEAKKSKRPTLSVGRKKVQEQLKRNRMRIKQMQKKSSAPKRPKQHKKNSDWMQSKQQQVANWQDKRIKQVNNWQIKKQKMINKWISERKKFLKRIPVYKKNLLSASDFKDEAILKNTKSTNDKTREYINRHKLQQKKTKQERSSKKVAVKMPIFSDYFVIDSALNVDIKDQGKRPTCAAFSGVRAIEIKMSQQNINKKLSEQYFFWSSKPKCQQTPCPKSGSWVINGYRLSQNATAPNIPLLSNCNYKARAVRGNATQTPLKSGCQNGFAQVVQFSEVQTLPEIVSAIKNGHPVVGGFKLSENFYNNTGYVFKSKVKKTQTSLDGHAKGHALLLVGIMKLPPELKKSEGSICLITANSWGVGWGKGGHACISQKWINAYRFDVPFIALEKIKVL